MAKDQFSFDIVSEVDLQEVRNAVDQAQREISQRFDFKDTETGISQDHTTIELRSSTEDRLKAALQVLKEKTKEITKFVKSSGVKVQTQIQGDQVRVLGKSKDDLQKAIAAVKAHDFGIALQFTNYRP